MNKVAFTLMLALILQGCTSSSQTPAPVPLPQPYQRFVPVATSDRDFALDTKTGQLCKTWSWTITDAPLSSLPLCSDLHNQTD
ncbi:MAG: hypothetical protein EXQ56_05830 [Acidobacteria bacterium]|nr:hypothetical protein [Acidobacteriota bacterium]